MPTAMDHTQIKFGSGIVIDPETGGFKIDPTSTAPEVLSGTGAPTIVPGKVNLIYIDSASGAIYISTGLTANDWVSTGMSLSIAAEDPTAAPSPNRIGMFAVNSVTGALFVSTGAQTAPYWIQVGGTTGPTGPTVTIAAGVPSAAPAAIGDLYYSSDNKALYVALGTTDVNSWKIVDNRSFVVGGGNPITSQVVPAASGALYVWGANCWIALGNTYSDWAQMTFTDATGCPDTAGYKVGGTSVVGGRQVYVYTAAESVVDTFDVTKYNALVTRFNAVVDALKAHGLIG